MNHEVEVVVEATAALGEGTNWDANRQCLYWVDIVGKELHVFDPQDGSDRMIDVKQFVGAAVPTSAGDLMLAMHHGFHRLDLDSGDLTPVYDPEAEIAEQPKAGSVFAVKPGVRGLGAVPFGG